VIVGPWGHTWPDNGTPGPRIDFEHEFIRFFEHWLAGTDNGVMDEPPITLYVQHWDRPAARRTMTSGEWRHETEWPLARGLQRVLRLAPGGLLTDDVDEATAQPGEATYDYNPTVGTTFGLFGGSSAVLLQPADQRLEDAWSTNWTSEPLDAPMEILGSATLALRVAVTAQVATVVARLIDVAPDGAAALVGKGVLNLTHRDSHENPAPLVRGRAVDVEIQFDATSWRFEPGHAVRIAITGTDYPLLWPSPTAYRATISVGAGVPSRLTLPVVPPRAAPIPGPDLRSPQPFTEQSSFALELPSWRVTRDQTRGTTEVELRTNNGIRLADGTLYHSMSTATTTVSEDDPGRAGIVGVCTLALEGPDHTTTSRARGEIHSDAEAFHVTVALEVAIDGTPYHARRWSRSYPRRLL
jgi:predicted acyl esterase